MEILRRLGIGKRLPAVCDSLVSPALLEHYVAEASRGVIEIRHKGTNTFVELFGIAPVPLFACQICCREKLSRLTIAGRKLLCNPHSELLDGLALCERIDDRKSEQHQCACGDVSKFHYCPPLAVPKP